MIEKQSTDFKYPQMMVNQTLSIPNLNDRIVQEVLRSVLEPIFESTFSDRTHVFRAGVVVILL